MDELEKQIAETLYSAIQDESNYSARSLQAADFRVGVSDLGFCSERVRRMIDQQVPEDTDMLTAWIGTELGAGMERAALRAWPDAIIQSEVAVTLYGEERSYTVTGHPDIILPAEGIVLDGKTDYGLSSVERTGPNQQQQFQRHGYALGAHEAGFFGDRPLSEVMVGNVWMDRAGIDKRLHCQIEPYDPDIVRDAGSWLDDAVYAYSNKEEARKEPPREMCAATCGFFRHCRAFDTDVEGRISDSFTLQMVSMYEEGKALESQGRKLKDQAKQHLVGVEGSTGEVFVRWVHVNESEVPSFVRRGHDKLDIRPIPKPKK